MNKIHKIIWSKVRHCYVVVSEITKRDGKSVGGFFTGRKRNLTLALLTFLSLSSVISFPVYADTIGTYHAGDLKWDKDKHNKAEWDPNHPVTDEDYGSIGVRSGKARLSFLMGLISGDTVAGKEDGLPEELKHRTAIGNRFRVFGFGATAYGYGTNAVGEGSLAVGHAATTNGNEGTAIGYYAKVLKGQGTVVGAHSWANDQAVALGADVRAQGYASISIGSDDADPKAFTGSKFSDKLPEETIRKIYKDMIKDNPDWFKNKYMIDDLGNDRRVWSPNYAAGEASIAIGSRTVALGDASTSIGVLAMALADRSTALGVRSLVSSGAKGGMALGEESRVMSKDGLAVGNKTYSSGDGSLAYGYDAKALGANSIAIGHNVGANAMLNHEAQVTMANVLLYNGEGKIKPTGTSFDTTQDRINYLERIMDRYDKKNKQWVDDEGSVLRQWKDGNNGPYKTEYRKKQAQTGPKQWSDNAIAIGRRTYAIGDNSLVLGSLSLGAGNNSLNVGHFTYTKGENSAAIGMESAAIADNSMAIGVRSFANLTNSIAVGVGSKTDYTKEDLEQDGWAPRNAITFPSSTQVGVVSVGKIGSERRISNVASGYRDTDAVNVSQLRSLEERFSSNLPEDSDLNPFSYLAVDKMHGDVTKVIPLQKKEMNYRKYVNYRIKQIELQVREKNKEKVDETFKDRIQNVITNLEKGDNKTGIDASGLKGKNVDTILNELKAKYPGLDISDTNDVINKLNEWKKEKLKDSLKKALTEKEQGFLDGTNYLNDGAKGKDAIAVGYKAQSLADNSIAIGKESHVEKGAQGGIALGASSSATRAGGQRAYDFDNDRVFADDNAAGRGQGGIHANKSDTGALSIGSANYTRQITNVAGGSEDTDAVNVAQLKQVNNKINGVDTKINSVDTKVNDVKTKVEGNIGFNIEGNTGGQPWVAAGTKDSQKGKISLKIRGGDNDSNINVDLGRSTKDGFDTIEAKINLNHNLGNLESATFTKTEKGVTTTSVINDKGLTIGSGNTAVALTKDGLTMGGHQIHGVTAGTAGTDAVNVTQMNNMIQAKAEELKKNEIKAAQDTATAANSTANTANTTATQAKSTASEAKSTAEQAKDVADKVNTALATYKTEVTTALGKKANTDLDNLTQNGKTVVKNLAKEQINTTVTETFVTGKVKKGSVTSKTLTVTGDGKVVGADLTLEINDKAISKGKLSDELVKEINEKATKDEVAKKAEKTYVDNQLNTKVNTSDFDTYKGKVTTDLAKKADVNGGNITAPGKWAEKLGTGEVVENNANLVTGGKVFAAIKDKADKSELTNKADTSLNNIAEAGKTVIKDLAKGAVKVADGTNTTVTTEDGKDGSKTYKVNVSDADIKKAVASDLGNKADKNTVTADLANKADKDASNIGDTERTAWAGKLGTGKVEANDANLVTGGKVYAAIKDKANTSLDNLTEQGKTEVKNLAGEKITETVTNTFVTDKVTKGSIKSDTLDVTGDGKAIGSDLTINIKDGSITKAKLNDDLKTEIEGKATKDEVAKKAEKTYVDNQLNTKVNTSDFTTYKGEVTTALGKKADTETVNQQLATKVNTSDFDTYKGKVTADLAGKADADGGNITAPGQWAEKLGTGAIADNDTNLVTGGKVFAAIKDKADKSELTNKADTSLNTITEAGKTVIKDLAKGAVKVADGTNTTVTTEDGTDGSKTYKVNVSDADIKKAVASDLDNKADKNTVTADLAKKADKDAGNIGDTERTAWANKLGTGTIADNDTNLVTGKTVYDFVNPIKTKSDNNATAITKLQTGFTIKDEGTGTSNVALGGDKPPTITFKAATAETDGATSSLVASVDADKNVTYTLNTKKLKEDLGITGKGVGSMSSWKIQATGGTATNVADGETVEFGTEENQGLTVKQTEKTIKYGINTDTVIDNINNSTTKKITNVDGDNIDLSKNTSITNITKADGLLSKKADKDASNIDEEAKAKWATKLGTGTIADNDANLVTGKTVKAALDKKVDTSTYTEGMAKKADVDGGNITAPGKWAEKLGTGTIADKDTNLVTGGKVYAAIKDKADKSELTNKADTSLNNITEAGKTVIKDLAKGAVKVADGTNTTVTTEDGTDGSKTYKVNVSDADIKKAVASDLDKKADKDAGNIDDTAKAKWAEKLGTGKVAANDANLVTGKTVYDFVNPVKTQAETNATNITGLTTRVGKNESDIKTLQEGFTIQDEATPNAGKKVIKSKDTITFKGDSNIKAAVGTDGSVTYGLNSALTNMNSITFAAPTAPAGGTSKALTINGTAGTITGLTNKTWNPDSITSGRAATEDQLKALSETVNGNASSSTDYQLVKAGTTETKDGTEAYKADKDGKIDLLVQDKNHKKNIGKITISDVASKSSLDALKEEMKKNIQVGGKGADGADGVDGTIGINGKDGKPGIGINVKDGGSITIHGTNSADGQDGQNGLTVRGVDGKNGEKGEKGVDGTTTINRIVTVDPNGTKHQVATLDDGLKFAGNSGNFYSKLNETVEIVGGVTIGEHEKAEDKLTDENIGVVAKKEEGKNGKLDIKLAKNLKNLSSATFTKTVENNGKKETTSTVINDSGTTVTDKDGNTNQTTAGGTVIQNKDGTEKVEIKKDGLTIGSGNTAVALTKDGLNNGGKQIKNIADGTDESDAVNKKQLDEIKTTLTTSITNKADYALAKGDGQDGAYKVTDGKITLKVKNKTKPDEAAEDVVIDDVASKSSLDTLKEEMKKNIQVGGKGADGADGVDGTIGINGKDGKLGIGINGKDGGSITIHGTNGADGQDGQNGLTIRGVDGKNGEKGEKSVDGKDINRIVTVDPNGTKHQLATLDDGLKFAGDSGDAIAKKLNETVTISGGVTDETKLSDNNVGVVAKDGKLNVKLAKNLTGLESATFTKTVENNGKKETTSTVIDDKGTTVTDKDGNTNQTTAGGTVIQTKDGKEKVEIKKDGITITDVEDGTSDNPKKKISLTKDGFNNGGNKITNIANGEKDSDAATVGQVNAAKQAAMDTLAAGFDVKAGTVTGTVSLKANEKPTVEFLSAGNGLSVDLTTDAATHTQKITYRLSDTPVFGEKAVPGEAGKPGKDGKDGKVEVVGKDGSAVVINGKDGSIGLKGKDGKDGIGINGKDGGSITIHGTNGTDGQDGQNGLTIRGVDGKNGEKGEKGVDGKDINRIVTVDPNGTKHQLATLDDGLKFAGDSGDAIANKLNETVTISGGVTDETKLSDNNIGVVAKDGKLNVKLAKNLTGLESATFTDKDGNTNKTTAGGTVIQNKAGTEKVEVTKNGITIMDAGDGTLAHPGKTISLTKDGFDNGGNKITNIADGTSDNDAATVGQVNAAKEEAKKHTTVEAGDHLSIKEETDKNGGKKYTITGPSITSEDGSVTVEDNTDKGKKIGYKLSVNTEKIAEKIGKTEIESGDTSTAEVTSTKDAKTNKTTYKVNVKDMHVESGEISYDKGEGTLTLKHKDGEKVEVKGIRNTYTESGEYDEKGKRIKFNRNGEKPFYVDMSKLVNGMNFGIAKLDNKINRVGSGAAALAALKPLEFDPEDKWDVAVGYGNYMGANSLALGAFYRPNENTMFSLGGSFGDGENIINVGLSMKVGKGIQRFISKAEMANRIVEQDAEIAQLKAKDAQREAEIKALREKDEQRELQMKEILKKLNMA